VDLWGTVRKNEVLHVFFIHIFLFFLKIYILFRNVGLGRKFSRLRSGSWADTRSEF
jgi:hypothetical protein